MNRCNQFFLALYTVGLFLWPLQVVHADMGKDFQIFVFIIVMGPGIICFLVYLGIASVVLLHFLARKSTSYWRGLSKEERKTNGLFILVVGAIISVLLLMILYGVKVS